MIRFSLSLAIACSLALPAQGQKILQHRKDKNGTTFAWYDVQTGQFSGHFFVPDEPKPLIERKGLSGYKPMQLDYGDTSRRKPKPENPNRSGVVSPYAKNRTLKGPTVNPGPISIKNPYFQEVQQAKPTLVDLFFQKIGESLAPEH